MVRLAWSRMPRLGISALAPFLGSGSLQFDPDVAVNRRRRQRQWHEARAPHRRLLGGRSRGRRLDGPALRVDDPLAQHVGVQLVGQRHSSHRYARTHAFPDYRFLELR